MQQQKRLSFTTNPDPECSFQKLDPLQFESIKHTCSPIRDTYGTLWHETSFNVRL